MVDITTQENTMLVTQKISQQNNDEIRRMFMLVLASCVDPSHSAKTTTSFRCDVRHYAEALEDLERVTTKKVAEDGAATTAGGIRGRRRRPYHRD